MRSESGAVLSSTLQTRCIRVTRKTAQVLGADRTRQLKELFLKEKRQDRALMMQVAPSGTVLSGSAAKRERG